MDKNYFRFFMVLLFFSAGLLSAQQQGPWSRTDATKINNSAYQIKSSVKNYKGFELHGDFLSKELSKAPLSKGANKETGVVMRFPDKDGQLVAYYVYESPVMASALSEKFPNNRSYSGVATDGSGQRIRFSWNELGLHAVITDLNHNVHYIEPSGPDKRYYKVYDRKDIDVERDFICEIERGEFDARKELSKKAVDLKLRTYRLALAATSGYSRFHLTRENATGGTEAQQKAVVLAALTTAITRVNAVLENDLAVRLELVEDNDQIIYLDPATDPYEGAENVLDKNQSNLDQVIQNPNYDVGHVVTTGFTSVARLSSVCDDGSKARGSTGSQYPVGENYYFDFLIHELGHQFGANHTWNGNQGSCEDQRQFNEATAVEPGSGSTLMAYAGLCTPQNVQLHSDLYFHIVSIEEILNHINGVGGSCPVEKDLTSNRNVPVANAGPDFTIPTGTAFVLKGSGSDADNDPISYVWEQTDAGTTIVPPSELGFSGALYRSVKPGASPNRYLPDLRTLAGGNMSSTWEVTPGVARTLNFRLTVRDNNAEAGQIDSDDLRVTVTDAAGPFVVTSQSQEGITWTPGANETITWNVAGTDGNGINVSRVNIRLSVDGGLSYPIELASNVPNDGSQIIAVPQDTGSQCYVMVEAVDNFFFAVNTQSFSVGSFNSNCDEVIADDTPINIPDNDPEGISSEITIDKNVTIEKVLVKINDLRHTYLSDLNISLESPSGTVVELLSGVCEDGDDIGDAIFDDEGAPFRCDAGAVPVISGRLQAGQALSIFKGEQSQGTWTLRIQDVFDADFGVLNSWGLEICYSEPVLGVKNYAFEDFNLYPNPTDGLMQVKFFSDIDNEVELGVYDVLGRRVYLRTYKDVVQNFRGTLNLEALSPGLYILRIKQANRIATHKLKIR